MGPETNKPYEAIVLVEQIQGIIILTNAMTFYCQVSKGSPFAKQLLILMGIVGFF